ncbi:MAG TPA: hypothetical protein VNM90_30445 [Haliangium sp.]|nr:hypothetical protein [Haliangium sp.]
MSVAECVVPPLLAEMIASVLLGTAEVTTSKLALVEPPATVMLDRAGRATAGLLLESVTTVPPVGAAAPSVTSALTVPPAVTVVDASPTVLTEEAGVSVKAALREPPSSVAVIDAVLLCETLPAVIENVRVTAPPGTVTVAGMVTNDELLDSRTCTPNGGAGASSVMVPVAVLPDEMLTGLTDNESEKARRSQMVMLLARLLVLYGSHSSP